MTDPEMRAHVEGMHPYIDRTLSDETLADEHRREHDFGNPNHPSRHDRATSRARVSDRLLQAVSFDEAMSIENPDQLGQVPASDELAAEVAEYRISREERHAAKVAFELRVTQLLDLMRDASSEENRLMAYDQAVHTVSASVKFGLGTGALPSYEEMTA